MSPAFYVFGNDYKFNHTTDTETLTYTVKPISLGFLLLAKYAYISEIGKVTVALENGIGVGSFLYSYSGYIRDENGEETNHQEPDDEGGMMISPALDLGLKVKFRISEYSSFGVGVGATTILMFLDNTGLSYEQPVVPKIGLNYTVISDI